MTATQQTAEEILSPFPIFVPQNGSKTRYKVGYVDKQGKLRAAPTFDDGTRFHNGYAAIKIKDKWGFIDASGNLVIEPRFVKPAYFESGVASVSTSRGYAVVDATGNFVLSPGFKEILPFS